MFISTSSPNPMRKRGLWSDGPQRKGTRKQLLLDANKSKETYKLKKICKRKFFFSPFILPFGKGNGFYNERFVKIETMLGDHCEPPNQNHSSSIFHFLFHFPFSQKIPQRTFVMEEQLEQKRRKTTITDVPEEGDSPVEQEGFTNTNSPPPAPESNTEEKEEEGLDKSLRDETHQIKEMGDELVMSLLFHFFLVLQVVDISLFSDLRENSKSNFKVRKRDST